MEAGAVVAEWVSGGLQVPVGGRKWLLGTDICTLSSLCMPALTPALDVKYLTGIL